MIHVSERAQEFLTALEGMETNEWVSAPGGLGPYRAKHLKRGLKEGLIVIHWTGRGLCWANAGAVERFEKVAEYEDRRPASKEATKKLLEQFKATQIGGRKVEVKKAPAEERVLQVVGSEADSRMALCDVLIEYLNGRDVYGHKS